MKAFVFVALLALIALSEDSPFAGLKVVVVGGTGTLGYAAALAYAQAGANVTLVSRNMHPNRPSLKDAAALINADATVTAAGGFAWFREADARNVTLLKAVFEEVGSGLDIVINAAGSLGFLGNLSDCKDYLEDKEHNPLMSYLATVVVSTSTAAEFMVASNHTGVIVNIGAYSETAKLGYNFYSPFFMAAARGVEAATYAAAGKYVLKGVRVNGLALGAVDTPFLRNMAKFFDPKGSKQPWEGDDINATDPLWKDHMDEVLRTAVPSGKLATVQDVVDGLFFLSDPETDYISGTILRVDGGYWATSSAF